jgi:hypothetical protein
MPNLNMVFVLVFDDQAGSIKITGFYSPHLKNKDLQNFILLSNFLLINYVSESRILLPTQRQMAPNRHDAGQTSSA